MILFGILFAIDAAALLVVLGFYLWGLADGTVGASNMLLWLALMAGPAAVLFGGWRLRRSGQAAAASLLLLLLAVPTSLLGLFFLGLLLMPSSAWH